MSQILSAGAQIATMQIGLTAVCSVGNQSSSLYGWQNFGTYDLFSYGTPLSACPDAQAIPFGTPFPSAYAYQLATMFAHPSEHMLRASLSQTTNAVAYAATQGSGYGLFLFNLDENNSQTITVVIGNQAHTSFAGEGSTYDKAIYDLTSNNTFEGPTTASLGSLHDPFIRCRCFNRRRPEKKGLRQPAPAQVSTSQRCMVRPS